MRKACFPSHFCCRLHSYIFIWRVLGERPLSAEIGTRKWETWFLKGWLDHVNGTCVNRESTGTEAQSTIRFANIKPTLWRRWSKVHLLYWQSSDVWCLTWGRVCAHSIFCNLRAVSKRRSHKCYCLDCARLLKRQQGNLNCPICGEKVERIIEKMLWNGERNAQLYQCFLRIACVNVHLFPFLLLLRQW